MYIDAFAVFFGRRNYHKVLKVNQRFSAAINLNFSFLKCTDRSNRRKDCK